MLHLVFGVISLVSAMVVPEPADTQCSAKPLRLVHQGVLSNQLLASSLFLLILTLLSSRHPVTQTLTLFSEGDRPISICGARPPRPDVTFHQVLLMLIDQIGFWHTVTQTLMVAFFCKRRIRSIGTCSARPPRPYDTLVENLSKLVD